MASASLDVCVVASFAIPNGFDCTGVFLTCLILSAKFHDIFELAKSVFAAGMRSFLRLWSRALAWARDDLAKEFTEADLLVHDETNLAQAFLLSQLYHPEFPEPMGVFYVDDSRPSYNDQLHSQVDEVLTKHGEADLQKLITGSDTWTVA